ncbi:MAG TPA: NlpC/P60 family protein [Gaiellaceae bacterium]|jgi:cell wall-associated NlpC family hydrolase
MRRLLPLLGVVAALALSGNAAADTFKVAHSHANRQAASFTASSGPVISFNATQSGPMSFAALRGIWQAAGATYGIPWQVLGAINKVETNFGANLGPSSAGAIGWMQFMPSTWARWGIDANGDGVADPDNPTDAIFSAARYLAGCGGQFDITRAVYCYNHSNAYVNEVLGLAALYGRGGGVSTGMFSVDLRPQLVSARKQIAASNTQLAAARARAGTLGRTEQHYLHVADTSALLSNQLAARKHAVLVGVRRDAAEARVRRLQKRLDSAHRLLGQLRDQASGSSFPGLPLGVPVGSDNGVVSLALQYLGVPYVWGGATPSGFDCSGLVQYVFAQLGVSLPHNTVAQWNDPVAVSVPRDALQPGDLVFFNRLDHVGIYIGNGYIVDAPHTGADVRIDSLSDRWFAANYDGAKRILGAQFGGAPMTGGAMTFTTGGDNAGSTAFTPDVVYFTH